MQMLPLKVVESKENVKPGTDLNKSTGYRKKCIYSKKSRKCLILII